MTHIGWRELVAGSSLALMIAAALAIAAGAAGGSDSVLHIHNHGHLPPELRGPFQSLGVTITGLDLVLLSALLGVCYLAALALADSISARMAIGAIVVLHLIFALAPPLLSSDIFNYVGYARIWDVHGLNPYEWPLASAPQDASYPFVGLKIHTAPYGPLFSVISKPIGGLGLVPAVWTLKGITAAASLGCVALVAACAKARGLDPLKAALFVGLNPVLLVWAVGGGHNDLLVMALALGGILLLLQDRPLGVIGLVGAVATKLPSGLLLPFAVLGARDRVRAALWTLASLTAAAAIAFVLFGSHLSSLFTELTRKSYLDSPNDIPGAIDDLLGLGLSTTVQSRIGTAVFAVAVVVLLVRVYRGADWLDGAGWATFALLASTTWFLPWYFVWFLPLAALSRRPTQSVVALVLTALIIALQAPTLLSPPGRHDEEIQLKAPRVELETPTFHRTTSGYRQYLDCIFVPALTKSQPRPGACKRQPAP